MDTYCLQLAFAHLGRFLAIFALAKLSIFLYEIAKCLIVDILYKVEMQHVLQTACIFDAIYDTLAIQYEEHIHVRSKLEMSVDMQCINWKALQKIRKSRYSAVVRLIRSCQCQCEENEMCSHIHKRTLLRVYVAAFSAQFTTALRTACALFLTVQAHPTANCFSAGRSGWAGAFRPLNGVQVGKYPRACESPAC